jgi:hypothetical protein
MSIFDHEPLPIGTEYWGKVIIGIDEEARKYLVEYPYSKEGLPCRKWLSFDLVERHHGQFLSEGVERRESKPGNSYNTHYFRNKVD